MLGQLERRVHDAKLANVVVEQADITALRFPADSFDAVGAANVLHLLPDLELALASLRHVRHPDRPDLETRVARTLAGVLALTGFSGRRRFTSNGLGDAIAASGFKLARAETIPGPLPVGFVEALAA
jgi:SAM-dependent methyltransferase